MPIAPLRILYNEMNLLRTATLTPSSVLPAENTVLPTYVAKTGTGSVALTGAYTGAEDVTVDVQVLDLTADVSRASAPVLVGAGSGTMTDITADAGFAAQSLVFSLKDAGIPITSASVDFEGVKIVARNPGVDGNNIHINIDNGVDDSPPGMVYTTSNFSLLTPLSSGQGSEASPLSGPEFDWNAQVLGADGQIPLTASRIAFGDDLMVYLQYKKYVSNDWQYFFVPALKRDIPIDTPIKIVTGGRTVQIIDSTNSPATVETYVDIETVYDLLSALRETSALVTVDGIVANDRSPTGQAARDLLVRTDAHADPSYGTGSTYAKGFEAIFVAPDASTERVLARCYATNGNDHPLAHLGAERWRIFSSLSGELVADAITGVPYLTEKWGFTIPQRLPPGYNVQRGKFAVNQIVYEPRPEGEEPPPICVVAMELGPNAVDETITLRYTKRPSGDCDCTDMPVPNLSPACLGLFPEGGSTMDYSAANQARLKSLYQWAADTVRDFSTYSVYANQAPFISQPMSFDDMQRKNFPLADPFPGEGVAKALNYIPKTLFEVIADWEATLALMNALVEVDPLRPLGEAAWDVSVAEFKADVGEVAVQHAPYVAFQDMTAGMGVCIFYDNDGVQKVKPAVPGQSRYGFLINDVDVVGGSPPTTAEVYFWGTAPGVATANQGEIAYMSRLSPGGWTEDNTESISDIGALRGVTSGANIAIADTGAQLHAVYLALLSDRYRSRMQQVMITGGISPLGKSKASTIDSGDGCWRDWGGDYWTVIGSNNGGYAPLFSNHVYYASRRAEDGKAYYSTKQFALQVNVACTDKLFYGDEIQLSIGNSGWPATYQSGDQNILPIIAAHDLYLAGGKEGSLIQTWNGTGSVDGPLAPYVLDPDAPTAYDSGTGLTLQINQGGIPYKNGDEFRLTIEGGHFQYRTNAGSWIGPLDIPDGPLLLFDGLSVIFTSGNAPSFAADDTFSFTVLQPRRASNLQAPGPEVWKFGADDTGPFMQFDIGSAVPVPNFAVALHTLPVGCTITVQGSASLDSPWAPDWTEALTRVEGPIFAEFTGRTAQYLRLYVTDADGASIGWAFSGDPITTELSAELNPMSRDYSMKRGDGGLYQGGRYLGKAASGSVIWTQGALPEVDVNKLIALTDYSKAHGDQNFIIVPNNTRPTEAFMGHVATDRIDWPQLNGRTGNAGVERRYDEFQLPISGVYFK